MRADPPLDDRPGLAALRRLPRVVGVAAGTVDAPDTITFLLDRDDVATRRRLLDWGKDQATPVAIQIIGDVTT